MCAQIECYNIYCNCFQLHANKVKVILQNLINFEKAWNTLDSFKTDVKFSPKILNSELHRTKTKEEKCNSNTMRSQMIDKLNHSEQCKLLILSFHGDEHFKASTQQKFLNILLK